MSYGGNLIGWPATALDTPALLVDLDVLEENIAHIASVCRRSGVRWRPHIKGQKTPGIVAKELAAGAVGVTCAKLGEAETMAAAGVRDILIANQIVGAAKIERLFGLLERADAIVAVDSVENVTELGTAARSWGRHLKVVIEANIGMNRAGVEPGSAVVALADRIAAEPGLDFVGLTGWESQAVTIADPVLKERIVAEAIGQLTASANACRQAGHDVQIVSCGGTGTFPYCARQPGVTEVQVGGGVFSDIHYRDHYHVDMPFAITVLTTVISRPTPTRLVLDAGKKAMSCDAAMPLPVGLERVHRLRLSAEHTTIELAKPSPVPRIGDRLEFIVGYTDTTVHLHEEMVGIRGGKIEVVWPVTGRGKLK